MEDKKKTPLLFGKHPVIDAIKAGKDIDKLLLERGTGGDFEKEIRRLSKAHNIPLQVVPRERMDRWTRSNHQGIIGLLSLVKYYHIEAILPQLFEKSEVPLLLVLDGVTDVRNFGAIARSAELCGVHAIIIPESGAAQINGDAIKTSAGALNDILICRERSLMKSIEYLQLSGVQVMASNLGAQTNLHELDLTQATALVIGSEGKGISKPVLKIVDQDFMIPQQGKTDSFNVSVATGIMLYETMRQRMG
ncbi:MAG: 23S rRNA (guanosine(2251)-2'-O)-methyltransferase RlmB [Saprospiraceae bacterium]